MTPAATHRTNPWTDFLRRSGPGRIALALTILIILLAVFAPWISPRGPAAQDLPARLLGPSSAHWMGTDELGRDVFARVLYGARISMTVGILVVTGAGFLGLALGAISGYFGGWTDRLINGVLVNAFLIFSRNSARHRLRRIPRPRPRQSRSRSRHHRLGGLRPSRPRTSFESERNGLRDGRALARRRALAHLMRHVLPNAIQPVLIQATIGMAGAILAESTLSFLGLGVLAPAPSWGAMLNDASSYLFSAPHMVIFPALAIMTAVLAFNLLGDALRDWLDPRTRAYLITLDLTR